MGRAGQFHLPRAAVDLRQPPHRGQRDHLVRLAPDRQHRQAGGRQHAVGGGHIPGHHAAQAGQHGGQGSASAHLARHPGHDVGHLGALGQGAVDAATIHDVAEDPDQPVANDRHGGAKRQKPAGAVAEADWRDQHQPIHPRGLVLREGGGDGAAHRIAHQRDAARDLQRGQQLVELGDEECAVLPPARPVRQAAAIEVVGQHPHPQRGQRHGNRGPDIAGRGQPVDANHHRAARRAAPFVIGQPARQFDEIPRRQTAAARVHRRAQPLHQQRHRNQNGQKGDQGPDHLARAALRM